MYEYKGFTIERQGDSIVATNGGYEIRCPIGLFDTRKSVLEVIKKKINRYIEERKKSF